MNFRAFPALFLACAAAVACPFAHAVSPMVGKVRKQPVKAATAPAVATINRRR